MRLVMVFEFSDICADEMQICMHVYTSLIPSRHSLQSLERVEILQKWEKKKEYRDKWPMEWKVLVGRGRSYYCTKIKGIGCSEINIKLAKRKYPQFSVLGCIAISEVLGFGCTLIAYGQLDTVNLRTNLKHKEPETNS